MPRSPERSSAGSSEQTDVAGLSDIRAQESQPPSLNVDDIPRDDIKFPDEDEEVGPERQETNPVLATDYVGSDGLIPQDVLTTFCRVPSGAQPQRLSPSSPERRKRSLRRRGPGGRSRSRSPSQRKERGPARGQKESGGEGEGSEEGPVPSEPKVAHVERTEIKMSTFLPGAQSL